MGRERQQPLRNPQLSAKTQPEAMVHGSDSLMSFSVLTGTGTAVNVAAFPLTKLHCESDSKDMRDVFQTFPCIIVVVMMVSNQQNVSFKENESSG